ncbi:MAG: HAD-IA family hydrolase [Armatimonadetes bacterium]|nr:HAD-IA family hydrolase [Armatimonadota bacterium]
MPEPLRAVLFDLDGTLVRTSIDFPAMRSAVHQVFLAKYPYIEEAHGNRETDTLALIPQLVGLLPETEREETRRELLAVVVERERTGCAYPEAIPGATELLQTLQAKGVGVGIVTRNARAIAESLCDRMNLPHDVLVAREDTAAFKPDPEPVRLACTRLGVPPENAAMVGDLWVDIAAGHAAGCALTIGLQWEHDPPNRFAKAKPTHIVTTFDKVSELLLQAVS